MRVRYAITGIANNTRERVMTFANPQGLHDSLKRQKEQLVAIGKDGRSIEVLAELFTELRVDAFLCYDCGQAISARVTLSKINSYTPL